MVPAVTSTRSTGDRSCGRGVAQPGQRACFGSRRSGVQISAPRPMVPHPGLLAGCIVLFAALTWADTSHFAHYRVRQGDNLTRIATRFGVSVGDLRQANKLPSDLIRVGQDLQIARPFKRTKAEDIHWQSPLTQRGQVLRGFGPYKNGQGVLIPQNGVDIGVPAGSTIRTPAHGVIRYVGPQDEYGTVMIIEHGAGYSTVLAPLAAECLAWRVDDAVLRGDILGKTDGPPQGSRPYFHLELRHRGKAIKPDRLLP